VCGDDCLRTNTLTQSLARPLPSPPPRRRRTPTSAEVKPASTAPTMKKNEVSVNPTKPLPALAPYHEAKTSARIPVPLCCTVNSTTASRISLCAPPSPSLSIARVLPTTSSNVRSALHQPLRQRAVASDLVSEVRSARECFPSHGRVSGCAVFRAPPLPLPGLHSHILRTASLTSATAHCHTSVPLPTVTLQPCSLHTSATAHRHTSTMLTSH